jgi:lipopolysaccharide transport system permease protein
MAWAVIQPFAGMIVFTLVFSKMAKLPTGGIPAPLFYYAGLLAWTFFSQTVNGASQSLIEGSRLITKVYFPRIMIPASAVGYTLLNMLISAALLLILMPYYGIIPSSTILLLPVLILLLIMTSLGIGVLIAALNVKYRDFRYVVPFMLQIWMFATPVVYPASMIPEKWRALASLNPMSGMVNGFRASLLGTTPDWNVIGIGAAVGIGLFIFGIAYFRHTEDEMADIL